ncbi:uncharacterized protein DUF4838 [Prosthecobacter fusiformis]|uniref:Uncharacterized protein DUF4838 n=1 Tax=Prosthecobacter fusiformis TaxID=48464 RepID=A0A4R7RMG5_9BACT|nr:DUF4838 domain-containing protein [Prosthecobacter fusiformis]TDU64154.1 uncharacterized protein DUF4838 [Prosthecobacter fusiformis]
MKHALLFLPLGVLFSVGLLIPGGAVAADLTLVSKSVAPAPIIVFADAPPRTRAAAVTLAEAIQKISGVLPPVMDGVPQPMPERAIWVGYQPALKALFPKTDFEFQHPEEILIAANEKHVVIAGRDRWDPARMDVVTREGKITGMQQEYGTVNAVYTFLQDQLGVRWFWPGDLGEDVVARESIDVAPMEYRYHPQIRSREGVFNFSSLGNRGYGRAHDWTMQQRLQLCSLSMEGGHGFGDWWDRFHKTHPEIFALQPDGTRSGFPAPRTAKLCMSNPKVWDLWMQEVAADLAQNPSLTVFNASPNDSWSSGHCVCDNCSAWDHPEGEPRLFHYKKYSVERPATSDRDVTFANKLGELLKEKYPGKDYRVLMLSYGHSRPAPVKARPADNVIMSIVANFFGRTGLVDRGSTRGDTYRQQFEAWAGIVPAMMWRPNTGSPGGWQQGLPDLSTQQTIRDIKDVAAANCVGIFIDGVWEHWATQGPQLYVMAQLVWNPQTDADAILKDYYQRAFGPAAAPVQEYFEGLEKARMAFTAQNGEADVFGLKDLYTEALLSESQARLTRAAAAVPAESVYARRVAFVQAGLTYTRLQADNIRLMEGYWKKKNPEIATQVRANWKEIDSVIAAHPYALNAGPIRPGAPRTLGLHPDHGRAKVKKVSKKAKADDLDLN